MKRQTSRRVGGMDAPGGGRVVPNPGGEHGGYTQLLVVRDPITALSDAVERAVTHTAALHALLADNECPHGTLEADERAQPGCTCFAKHRPPAKDAENGRVIGRDGASQTILCVCGATWTRVARRGRLPKCPACRGETQSTLTKE